MDKKKIKKRFDSLAEDIEHWKERNRCYYTDQDKYFKFLVPEGMSILDLGCGTGDLLYSLKPG